MTREEFESLRTGDVVKSNITGHIYTVADNAGGWVTVACVVRIACADNWSLIGSLRERDGTEEKAYTGGA
jgi:hypothetical protein